MCRSIRVVSREQLEDVEELVRYFVPLRESPSLLWKYSLRLTRHFLQNSKIFIRCREIQFLIFGFIRVFINPLSGLIKKMCRNVQNLLNFCVWTYGRVGWYDTYVTLRWLIVCAGGGGAPKRTKCAKHTDQRYQLCWEIVHMNEALKMRQMRQNDTNRRPFV